MVLRGSKTKSKTPLHLMLGGFAGTISRTCVAPLDRVKILLQTTSSQSSTARVFLQTWRTEGVQSLWKGNMLNCARIFPYAGLQFATYDWVRPEQPTTLTRLGAGVCAGWVATTCTHPIDVIRHRLICYADVKTFSQATRDIIRERALFKGYGSTAFSLTPFIAVNFTIYDTLKQYFPSEHAHQILGLGAGAAILSQTICYPLDTLRRRMQMRERVYRHALHALKHILQHEGVGALYAGMTANVVKIVPNNSIRFLVYDMAKKTINDHIV